MSVKLGAALAALLAALVCLLCACEGLGGTRRTTESTADGAPASATDAAFSGAGAVADVIGAAQRDAQSFYDGNYNSGFHAESPEELFRKYFSVFGSVSDCERYMSLAYENGSASPQGGSTAYKWRDGRFGDEYFLLFNPDARELSFTFTPVLGECFMIEIKSVDGGWAIQWASLSGEAWESRTLSFEGLEGTLCVTSGLAEIPASIYGVALPSDFARTGDIVLRAIGGSVGM